MQHYNVNYDYIYKYITIGDTGVGKSSMTTQYIDNRFSKDYSMTIGVEFSQKIIVAEDGTRIKIQIWDTAGQEAFRSITMSYYRGVVCALIIYDISSRTSFKNVSKWLDDVKELAPENVVIVLVGNKTDKEKSRKVSYEEGNEFAKANGLLFFESSSQNNESVNEIFTQSANAITNLIKNKKYIIDGTTGITKYKSTTPVYIESDAKTKTKSCNLCYIF